MHCLFRTTVFAAAFLAAAVLPAHAAVDPEAVIPVGPQVTIGKLPNGLTYYIQKNGKPEHRLELRLVVKAGSVLEDDDQRGLAHLLEHMAFNGSAHFGKRELVSYLESIGVKMGADLNAFTSYDETVYILPVPTERPEYVDKAFTVLEDWAQGLTLADADVEKERPIVLEEARLRKGAGERLNKILMPKLFNGSRYAEREPIGLEDVIRTASPDAVRRFYRDWYRPDLMAVVAVGDIDPQEAERMIVAHFAKLVNPAKERPRNYPDIPTLAGTDAVVVTDDEVTTNSVLLRYPVRYEPDRGTYGIYRDRLYESLVGIMMNARLAEAAQQPNPPFMGGAGGTGNVTPRHRAYSIGATLGSAGVAPAIDALLQEQRRVRQYGFSQAELDRARKNVLRNYERAYNERDTTNSASFVGEYQRNFLAGEPVPGIAAEYRLVQELLPAVQLSDINAFASRSLPGDSGKLAVYVGGTKGAAAPTGPALLADVAAAEGAKVAPRNEKTLATKLMERPANAGKIVLETQDKALGVTQLTLSNGVKVILKPTPFTRDQVLLSAQRFGGQTLFDAKDIPNTRYASSLAASMGLKDFAPLDLQKILAGRNAEVSMSLGSYTDDIGGHSGAGLDDIETMFQFLWLRFNGVRRDENLYKSFMSKQQEVVRNRLAAPEARFGDAVVDALYGGHPYEPRALIPEEVAHVDLDRSLALYRQRFASARGLTFILVGDFDVAAIKPLAAAYLGTLPVGDVPLAYRDVGLRFAKGVVRREVKAGTEPKSVVSLTFTGPAAWSPAATLRMAMLSEVMNLRVFEVLREKLGLIYGGHVGGAVQHIPYQYYTISASLPTGPENVDKVVAATFAEIDRIKADGPTQAELDKVKANWHQGYARSLQENGYWLGHLQSALTDGTDPHRILTIDDEARQLTRADIQDAAQRYFNRDNYVQVVLNPEAPLKTAHAEGQPPAR
jgi:zinc protease